MSHDVKPVTACRDHMFTLTAASTELISIFNL